MRDVLFLLVIVGFFAIAALLVTACDRIVGPDPSPTAADPTAKEALR